jgi:ectoine hydroxylase-related dioxygenase (phytanoyl-CoA dioxygenase family)
MVDILESPHEHNSLNTIDLAALLANTKLRVDSNAWEAICTGLSIASTSTNSEGGHISKSGVYVANPKFKTKHERRREKLIRNGYALVDDLFDVQRLRQGIEDLHKHNLPATFILLFDETWRLACESKRVLEQASHKKNVFNYDLLAWYIPPGSPGFSPHRDRQPDDAPSTFHSDDQQAKFITNWIALSDATPENSCLYVIPKPYDPGYTKGDSDNVADDNDINDCDEAKSSRNSDGSADPLHRALSSKESFQHVRCLPRKAGQSILFTHRIIHWGSQGDPADLVARYDDEDDDDGRISSVTTIFPRIAISFVCSDPDYEAPLLVNHKKYFSTDSNSDDSIDIPQFPPLHIRLLLVCAQLLIYYQRFDLEKPVIKACYDYCKQHEEELEETYRRKVFVEFVNAMKEQNVTNNKNKECANTVTTDATAATQTHTRLQSSSDVPEADNGLCDDDDENDEDAMLEEMLNAEAGGYGEFEDDYDDLEQGDEYDDDDEEEELAEEFDLFGGKRKNEGMESSVEKKVKTFIN